MNYGNASTGAPGRALSGEVERLQRRVAELEQQLDDATSILEGLRRDALVAGKVGDQQPGHLPVGVEHHFLKLAQHIPQVGTWNWDGVTRQLTCAGRVFQVAGIAPLVATRPAQELIELVHPDDRQRLVAGVRGVLKTETPCCEEIRLRFADNEYHWLLSLVGKIVDPATQHAHAIGVLFDISPRKRAEEALRQGQHFTDKVLRASPGTVYILDLLQQTTVYLNREAEQDLGYTLAELQSLPPLLHPDDQARLPQFLARWETAADGDVLENEIRLRHRDGRWRWRLVREMVFARDARGAVTEVIGVGLDITARKEMEQALAESEQRQRLAAVATGFGVYDFDPRLGRAVWSPELKQIFGLAPGDDPGSPELVLDQIHPDDRARFLAATQSAAAAPGMDRHTIEFRLRRADGTIRWLHDRAQLYWEYAGGQPRLARVIGTVIDITERKATELALRESEEQFRLYFEHAPVGMAQAEPSSGRLTRVNASFCKLTGYPASELYERTIRDITHPEDRERDGECFRRLVQGESPEHHTLKRYVTKNGQVRWVEVHATLLRDADGQALRATAVILDVTERHEAERRKDEFLAMLAHELRNPLAPIANAVALLELVGSQEPQSEWARDVIGRQARQMSRLVDDLMDISRINRGKIRLQQTEVDMATIVARAAEVMQSMVQIHGHRLSTAVDGPSLWVRGDPIRLEQVLTNLLTNACKYTGGGGTIWLSAGRVDQRVFVSVRDTGVGISADLLPHVFDLFTQADRSLDRAQGGLGIGLTIVKQLIELHGGTVEAQSDGEGRGSIFTIHLPALPEECMLKDQGSSDEAARLAPSRIVVVDDNEDAAWVLKQVLENAGQEVAVAHDGHQALQLIHSFKPAVAILDLGLPGLNGYDLARALRQSFDRRELMLVALSGYGQPEDIERAHGAGFDKHLVKPARLNELFALLAKRQAQGGAPGELRAPG